MKKKFRKIDRNSVYSFAAIVTAVAVNVLLSYLMGFTGLQQYQGEPSGSAGICPYRKCNGGRGILYFKGL